MFYSYLQVTVYYPSGTKTVTVHNPTHRTICKAFFEKDDLDRIDNVIVQSICKTNPAVVVAGSSQVVKEEAKQMCRNETILRRKDNESLLSFTLEELYCELREKCPFLLTMLTNVITDKLPAEPVWNDLKDIVMTAAMALHGRNKQMSALHYVMGFILSHGGCTLQVWIRPKKIAEFQVPYLLFWSPEFCSIYPG